MAKCRVEFQIYRDAQNYAQPFQVKGWDYVYEPYIYDRTSGISLRLSEGRASLSFGANIKTGEEQKEADEMVRLQRRGHLIRDGILKSSALHAFRYGRLIDENYWVRVCIQRRGSQGSLVESEPCGLYGTAMRLPAASGGMGIEPVRVRGYLNSSKAGKCKLGPETEIAYERLFSSLWALVLAKSKDNVAERFVNLWMALNGVYGFLANAVWVLSAESSKNHGESSCIDCFAIWLDKGLSEEEKFLQLLPRDDNNKVLTQYVRSSKEPHGMESLDGRVIDSWASVMEGKGDKPVSGNRPRCTPLAYLMLGIGYGFRCSYVHANKPLPVLCFDSSKIECLREVNKAIEDYLDEYIWLWFDPSYVKSAAEFVIDHRKNR